MNFVPGKFSMLAGDHLKGGKPNERYTYSPQIGIDFLALEERPDPSPGPSEVVLRMRAVALNYRDLAIARRHYHVAVEPVVCHYSVQV